ncbi:hypothetical protein KIPB_017332, partial [Kipferlia bialata]
YRLPNLNSKITITSAFYVSQIRTMVAGLSNGDIIYWANGAATDRLGRETTEKERETGPTGDNTQYKYLTPPGTAHQVGS